MAQKPETKFTINVLKKLREAYPSSWFLKTQMLSIVGIPDIIFCHRGHFGAYELKVGANKITRIQARVLDTIERAGGITAVVYPENLDEEIRRLNRLSDIRG